MTLENESSEERTFPSLIGITVRRHGSSLLIIQPLGKRNTLELEIHDDGTWSNRTKCNDPKKCEEVVELQLLEIPNAK